MKQEVKQEVSDEVTNEVTNEVKQNSEKMMPGLCFAWVFSSFQVKFVLFSISQIPLSKVSYLPIKLAIILDL